MTLLKQINHILNNRILDGPPIFTVGEKFLNELIYFIFCYDKFLSIYTLLWQIIYSHYSILLQILLQSL